MAQGSNPKRCKCRKCGCKQPKLLIKKGDWVKWNGFLAEVTSVSCNFVLTVRVGSVFHSIYDYGEISEVRSS